MKNLALVLATLCIFAQAATVFQAPAFVQLKKTPFGSSVAALIELNMSQSGRLDAIAEALDLIEEELNAQKTSNDDQISADRAWCDEQKTTLSGQITQLQSDIAAFESEKASLLGEQSTTNTNLANERVELASNQQHKADDEQAIVDENTRYAAAAADYAEAIAACEEALAILNTLVVAPSGFIQSKAKFSGVVALLEKHLAKQTSTFVKPVLSVLAELSSTQQVNQGQLAQVISLINSLLNELRNQQAQNESNHVSTIQGLNTSIENLTTLIDAQNTQITTWENRLIAIATRLEELAGLITVANAFLDLAQNQYDSTVELCQGHEDSYAAADADVQQQLATLNELREYFNNHVVPAVEKVDDASYNDSLTV